MPIKAKCDTCMAVFNVPDAAAGKSFLCKNCGAKVKVPDGSAPAELTDAFPVGFTHTPKQKSLPVFPLVFGGVALLVVIVAALVVPGMLKSGGGDNEQAGAGDNELVVNTPEANDHRQRQNELERERERRQTQRDRKPQPPPKQAEPTEEEKEQLRLDYLKRQREIDWKGFQAFEPEPILVFERPALSRGNADKWGAVADPPAEASAFTPQPGLEMVIKGGFNLPETRGPFCVSYEHIRPGTRETFRGPIVYDMRTGREVWGVNKQIHQDGKIGITPNGKRLIALKSTGSNQTRSIFVINHNQPMNPLKIDLPDSQYGFYRFDRPLVYHNDRSAFLYRINKDTWVLFALDLRNGNRLWQAEYSFPNRSYGWYAGCAVSPGGRFIAVPVGGPDDTTKILLIETGEGKLAGQIGKYLPDEVGGFTELGFSPDGSKLFGNTGYHHHAVWDMNTGELLELGRGSTQSYSSIAGEEAGSDLLDNSGRLMVIEENEHIIDTRSGMILGTLREPNREDLYGQHRRNHSFHRVFENGQFLTFGNTVTEANGTELKEETLFLDEQLDLDYYRAMLTHIDVGGTPAELGLPLLKEYYVATVERENEYRNSVVPPDRESAWPLALKGEPTTLAGQFQTRRITLPFVPRETNQFSAWNFTISNTSDSGQVLVTAEDDRTWLIDLKGQAEPKLIELPGRQQALSISNDGTHGIFLTGRNRIDVMRLDDLSILHSVRFREKQYNSNPKRLRPITSARLIDQDTLWIDSSLINLAERKLIYRGKFTNHDFSRDGRYLLVSNRQGIVAIDTKTTVGVAEFAIEQGGARSASISPDGKRVAVLNIYNGLHRLQIYSATNGQLLNSFALPVENTQTAGIADKVIGWVSDVDVLLNSNSDVYLTDTNTGRVLWRYTVKSSQSRPYYHKVRAGYLWQYAVNEERTEGTLYAHKMPHPEAAASIDAKRESLKPAEILIQPGDSIRLEIVGLKYGEHLHKKLIKEFEVAGFQISDQAAKAFRVSLSTTNETVTYRSLRADQPEPKQLYLTKETYTLEWVDADGRTLWSDVRLNGHRFDKFVRMNNKGEYFATDSGDMQADYDKELEMRRLATLGRQDFPVYLTTSLESQLLGASDLRPEGMVPEPKIRPRTRY